MPGIMPVQDIAQDLNTAALTMLRQSTRMQPQPHVLPLGAHHRLVTQQAINVFTFQEQASYSTVHTPHAFMKHVKMPLHSENLQAQCYIQ
jgi:hypothetical protein